MSKAELDGVSDNTKFLLGLWQDGKIHTKEEVHAKAYEPSLQHLHSRLVTAREDVNKMLRLFDTVSSAWQSLLILCNHRTGVNDAFRIASLLASKVQKSDTNGPLPSMTSAMGTVRGTQSETEPARRKQTLKDLSAQLSAVILQTLVLIADAGMSQSWELGTWDAQPHIKSLESDADGSFAGAIAAQEAHWEEDSVRDEGASGDKA